MKEIHLTKTNSCHLLYFHISCDFKILKTMHNKYKNTCGLFGLDPLEANCPINYVKYLKVARNRELNHNHFCFTSLLITKRRYLKN